MIMNLRNRKYIVELKDNQGRDLEAVKKHHATLARMDKISSKKSTQKYAEYVKRGWRSPDWTRFEGANCIRSGNEPFIALPTNGRKNARNFVVLDIRDRKDFVVQLRKNEVSEWLFSAWKRERGL
jgi:hypothetical protein